MESLFKRVENLGAWNSYIRTFQTVGVTDEELSLAMTDAMFTSNWDVLYNLISRTRSGRRVFKQLCLKGTVQFLVHLEARQESDLAFNVIVGQNMWNFVLEFYHHSDVTQRSRRQAFWRAVRQQAWDYVTKMAASDVTWERDRRAAFLAAVRQEQFGWAVQLCNQMVAVTDGDLRFAIKTCFATGHCDDAIEFLQCSQMSDETRYKKVLRCILKEAVYCGIVVRFEKQMADQSTHKGTETQHQQQTSVSDFVHHWRLIGTEQNFDCVLSNKLPTRGKHLNTVDSEHLIKYMMRLAINSNNVEYFTKLCGEYVFSQGLVQYAFKKALKGDKSHFIIRTIADNNGYYNFRQKYLLPPAVQLAVKTKNWDIVRKIVDVLQCSIDVLEGFVCVPNLLKVSKNWPFVVPLLESLIKKCNEKVLFSFTGQKIMNQLTDKKVKYLAKWCEKNDCLHLSVCLSVKMKNWCLAKKAIDAIDGWMRQGLVWFILDESVDNKAWDVTVACLKHASADVPGYEIVFEKDAMPLIDMCRSEGMKDWVVRLAVWSDQWQIVETEIESCDDETLRNFVLIESADQDRWEIVSKLLTKCSGSESCLRDILRFAVNMGECQCAKTLMNMINPISDYAEFPPIMCLAVGSVNPQEMVSVCIAFGVSTHHPTDDRIHSQMKRALNLSFVDYDNDELFFIIKVLFESGACSHKELRHIKNGSYIQWRLKRSQLDILQYMEEAANRPHSLQNLCRLTVSHRIGCQPGREDRVLSLPLPALLKGYIMFSDLTYTRN